MWGKVNSLRQTYGCSGYANGAYFSTVKEDSDYALLSMSVDPNDLTYQNFPREKRVLVIMENPSVWKVPQEVLDFAGVIISPFVKPFEVKCKWIINQPAIPWFYGINFATDKGCEHHPMSIKYYLEDLEELLPRKKSKLLSIIVSGKAGLPGYEWRKSLAYRLKNVLGSDCDIFGFGHRPVADKATALDDYIFSLAIENEGSEHYWTEKLADPILGFTVPIYSGASSVQDYFPCKILQIPFLSDVDNAVKLVLKYISQYSPSMVTDLMHNREHLIHRQNLFCMIPDILRNS